MVILSSLGEAAVLFLQLGGLQCWPVFLSGDGNPLLHVLLFGWLLKSWWHLITELWNWVKPIQSRIWPAVFQKVGQVSILSVFWELAGFLVICLKPSDISSGLLHKPGCIRKKKFVNNTWLSVCSGDVTWNMTRSIFLLPCII